MSVGAGRLRLLLSMCVLLVRERMCVSKCKLSIVFMYFCSLGFQIVDGDISVLFSGCQSEGQGRTFESSGNRMSVYFMSDESTEKAGFVASYEGIERVIEYIRIII